MASSILEARKKGKWDSNRNTEKNIALDLGILKLQSGENNISIVHVVHGLRYSVMAT